MAHNFVIGGVILSPLVPQLLISLLLTVGLTVILMRLGFYRLVWHRPIVELAIFCIFLAIVTLLVPELWSWAVALFHPGESS